MDTASCKVENPWTVEGDEYTDAMKRAVLAVDFEQTDHMIVRYELTLTLTLTLNPNPNLTLNPNPKPYTITLKPKS